MPCHCLGLRSMLSPLCLKIFWKILTNLFFSINILRLNSKFTLKEEQASNWRVVEGVVLEGRLPQIGSLAQLGFWLVVIGSLNQSSVGWWLCVGSWAGWVGSQIHVWEVGNQLQGGKCRPFFEPVGSWDNLNLIGYIQFWNRPTLRDLVFKGYGLRTLLIINKYESWFAQIYICI